MQRYYISLFVFSVNLPKICLCDGSNSPRDSSNSHMENFNTFNENSNSYSFNDKYLLKSNLSYIYLSTHIKKNLLNSPHTIALIYIVQFPHNIEVNKQLKT